MSDQQQPPAAHQVTVRALVITFIIGAAIGAGFIVAVAGNRLSVRDCIDGCKAIDARSFYAADGACLCIPACPACTQVTAIPVEEKTSNNGSEVTQ